MKSPCARGPGLGIMPTMTMIRVLPEILINQIAAGEVIVRPASIVKETVENAIDAGSTKIRVEIGRECRDITVIDDGGGMAPEDALLAVERHATSKIRDLDDLGHITTRGFRGEALASIAAVSRLEIITRPADAVAGFRVRIEGGRMVAKGPIGCPAGTTVRVRDLFYNTPARRKFLKTDTAELNAIMQLLTRQMLARGDLGFTIVREGRKNIELPTDQPLASRMVHLLGNLAEEHLVKVNADRHGIRVYGYTTKPQSNRKDRRGQYFFVNSRPVSHRSMGYALGQAYHGLLMNGRYPTACLFIDVPPDEVDVNVHPTKEEVRFKEESKVTGVLNRAVVEALRGADLMPSVDLSGSSDASADAPPVSPYPFAKRAEQLGFGADALPFRRFSDAPLPGDAPQKKRPPIESSSPPVRSSDQPTPEPDDDRAESPPVEPATGPSLAFADPWEAHRSNRPVPLGQVGDCYLLVQWGDDLVIVDQHAAHERINYNKIIRLLENDRLDIQPLLIPVTVDVAARDEGRLEEVLPLLRRMGLETEHFGGQTWVVRSVPACLPDMDVMGAIEDLLSDDEDQGGLRDATPHRRLAARMACHASIKAHQRLSVPEIRILLGDLLDTDHPDTCPHGRPTMIRLSREELDKQFKRT